MISEPMMNNTAYPSACTNSNDGGNTLLAPKPMKDRLKLKLPRLGPTSVSCYLAALSFLASLRGHDWSAFLTSFFAFRMLANVQLALFVWRHQSVEGISTKSAALYACSHVFRLSSTLWLKGYLPSDCVAEHFLTQSMDIVSLICLIYVLYSARRGAARETHMSEADSMSFWACFIFVSALAYFLHGDLDDKPLFDGFFFIGVYSNCFALVPQAWLMYKDGFKRQYLSWNYLLPLIFSAVASMTFWYKAYPELTPWDCEGCVNWVGYATLHAHVIHCLLVAATLLLNAPVVLKIDVLNSAVILDIKIPTIAAAGKARSGRGNA